MAETTAVKEPEKQSQADIRQHVEQEEGNATFLSEKDNQAERESNYQQE